MKNKAYQYAKDVVNKKITAPKYVIKQCENFLEIAEDKNPKYMINKAKANQIESILKILIMPKGLKAGQSIYECSCGYQWVFYISILCIVYRNNPNKRRYETAILEIARKNFKTYTIATLFILLLLM